MVWVHTHETKMDCLRLRHIRVKQSHCDDIIYTKLESHVIILYCTFGLCLKEVNFEIALSKKSSNTLICLKILNRRENQFEIQNLEFFWILYSKTHWKFLLTAVFASFKCNSKNQRGIFKWRCIMGAFCSVIDAQMTRWACGISRFQKN